MMYLLCPDADPLSSDAIGSVSFHPLHPLLLSVSGSRHFTLPSSNATSESEDSDEADKFSGDEERPGQTGGANSVRKELRGPGPYTLDSSVKIWGFSGRDGKDD
jgi:hypothetical protein